MHINPKAQQLLSGFIKNPKFETSEQEFFLGLSNPKLKPQLSGLINQAAQDFMATATHHPTEAKFQHNISIGLKRFDPLYLELDTEDRERICKYFEKLMDCVGLESSDGQLNKWMYDFDPSRKPDQD